MKLEVLLRKCYIVLELPCLHHLPLLVQYQQPEIILCRPNDLDALEDQTQILNTNIRSEEWGLSYIVSSPPTFKNTILAYKLWLKIRFRLERGVINLSRDRNNLSIESRNMLLVVAVLIATVAYQGALSPPGG